jgi:enoyl-CoA hydratase/carnithine racemase
MELTPFRTIAVPPVISAASLETLAARVTDAMCDEAVPGLVLQGESDAFSGGMDLGSFGHGQVVNLPDADFERSIRLFADLLCVLTSAPKPTVAVVEGAALGGGLGLAAACDVVVAARRATFGLPEGIFGLAPAVITPILLERITGAALRRLALTAEPIRADEAKAIGLVDELVENDGVGVRVRRLCTALSRVHPRTKSVLVEAISQRRKETLAASIQWGVGETTRAGRSPEVAERIRRFLEGGAPWNR